jgi:hypothetical protein
MKPIVMVQINKELVIPGRRSVAKASPESMTTDCGVWIPGCRAGLGPRNDSSRFTVCGAA